MQNAPDIPALLEPTVEGLGYELVHHEFARQGGDPVLRIYIDAPGGIRVDDCELVSRQVSVLLDVEDAVTSSYVLEVSSPGLDRPLVKPGHFRRFVGDRAKVVMNNPMLGRRGFSGRIEEARGDVVVLRVDGENYELPYCDMKSARLDPVF